MKMIVDPPRPTTPTFKNPRMSPNPLKYKLNATVDAKITPKITFPFTAFIHMRTFGCAKRPHPARQEGAPKPLEDSSIARE